MEVASTGLISLQSDKQTTDTKFYPGAHDLPNHGLLTRITVPGIRSLPEEQALYSIGKQLVTSTTHAILPTEQLLLAVLLFYYFEETLRQHTEFIGDLRVSEMSP